MYSYIVATTEVEVEQVMTYRHVKYIAFIELCIYSVISTLHGKSQS